MFYGGIIAYHNAIKTGQLAVKPETIKTHGAVSEEVAKEMASACREKLGVDIAVSVTGIAGPGGGTKDKPIGTVWIGLATMDGVSAKRYNFTNQSRNKVRDYTCLEAMKTMLTAIG